MLFIVFIPPGVNIHTFLCRSSNVFGYGMLPTSPPGMLRNTRYKHHITCLKPRKILNSETYLAQRDSDKAFWT